MQYLLIFSGSVFSIIFLTPWFIPFLKKYNIVDYPGGRKKHSEPVPRMGGLLIYAPVLASLSIFSTDYAANKILILSSGIIILCGAVDDIARLKWQHKYLLQSIGAAVFLLYFYPITGDICFFSIYIPKPLDLLILYCFITGTVNAVNMLDGLDGLVSGTGLLIFMLVFILGYISGNNLLMIISASLAGSLFGFLKFNAFPATIFLGDSGSLLIGYFLSVCAVILPEEILPYGVDLGFSVILMGVPLIDTIKVILIRLSKGKSPFQPDRYHIHHRIQDNNIHHKHIVFIIQLFTAGFLFISAHYLFYNRNYAMVLYAVAALMLIFFNPLCRTVQRIKQNASLLIPVLYYHKFSVENYRKVLIPGSALIIIFIFLYVFPSKTAVAPEIIIFLTGLCILLMAAAYISFRRYKNLNDIYVFLNLIIVFAVSDSGKPVLHYFRVEYMNRFIILDAAIAFILFFIGVFVIFREKIFGKRVSIFSGLDLTMMVFVLFIITIQNIIEIPAILPAGIYIFASFMIYIWYKMVLLMVPEVSMKIYIIAFILPYIVLGSIVL